MSEESAPKTLTRPAKIAAGVMAASAVGFLGITASGVAAHGAEPDAIALGITALRHGFEGALVGGICDFIAVRQVYSKARVQFDPLVEGVSRTVVRDLIQVEALIQDVSKLEAVLDDPSSLAWFRSQIEALLPDREALQREIEDAWSEEVRAQVAGWMADADLTSMLSGRGVTMALLDRSELREAAARCLELSTEDEALTDETVETLKNLAASITLADLGLPAEPRPMKRMMRGAWERWSELADPRSPVSGGAADWMAEKVIDRVAPTLAPLVRTTTLLDVAGPALSRAQIIQMTHQLAAQIRAPAPPEAGEVFVGGPGPNAPTAREAEVLTDSEDPPPPPPEGSQIYESAVRYMGAFVDAWHALEREERLSACEALVDVWEEPLIEEVLDLAWWVREKLMTPEAILDAPPVRAMLTRAVALARDQAGEIEEQAELALRERLSAMGADGFVQILQRNTQEELDWIKVNGTMWGMLIGTIMGAIVALESAL